MYSYLPTLFLSCIDGLGKAFDFYSLHGSWCVLCAQIGDRILKHTRQPFQHYFLEVPMESDRMFLWKIQQLLFEKPLAEIALQQKPCVISAVVVSQVQCVKQSSVLWDQPRISTPFQTPEYNACPMGTQRCPPSLAWLRDYPHRVMSDGSRSITWLWSHAQHSGFFCSEVP